MPEALKIVLYVLLGVIATVAIFSLIVAISCSINGLTFGEQICTWFGADISAMKQMADSVAQTPMA